MGRTHSNVFRKVGYFFESEHQPVLKAVCGRTEANTKAFADKWGYESIENDWRKLIDCKDIDVIDIVTPNDNQMEIVVAAAQAGKMNMCEKPLARDTAGNDPI